jgi:group I intron endonuclease
MLGIYKITNPSGKVYIGQSWNIADRKYHYKGLFCKEQTGIYNSLKKYGWKSHSFEIIHELPEDTSQEVLDRYEILYWQQYKDCNVKVLNAREPGRGGKLSKETRQKMSIARKGFKHSQESIRKISATKVGHKHSEETKRKIGIAGTGRPAANRRIVEQYAKNGEFIREFSTLKSAALHLEVKGSSAICECCQGKIKSYKGFIWKYKLN